MKNYGSSRKRPRDNNSELHITKFGAVSNADRSSVSNMRKEQSELDLHVARPEMQMESEDLSLIHI